MPANTSAGKAWWRRSRAGRSSASGRLAMCSHWTPRRTSARERRRRPRARFNRGRLMAEPAKPAPNRAVAASNSESAMRIDPAQVRELAQLLTDNELTEIEVADGDRRIRVKREPAAILGAAPAAARAPAPALSGPPAHGK